MCGICGFFQPNLQEQKKHNLIKEMNDLISHRGPDDDGYYVDPFIALGHRRLSIVDLALGAQPIFNENKNLVIIYNGEIYNYVKLSEELKEKGHKFRTHSDTEMIIHLYEEYGPDCLQYMNGMFAFAIWDIKKKELFIARDRFGIKPLYFYKKADFFAFSSEIKPLLKHPRMEKELNLQALDSFFNVRYIPAPQTMFKNLYKLKPGHFLIFKENGKLEEKQYWDIPFPVNNNVESKPEAEMVEEFRDRFENSVQLRLMSEVPLGILLSGGLDSSVVVAGLSRNIDNKLKTFSVGFKDDEDYNEFSFARQVADKFDTDHHEVAIDYDDFIKGIDAYLSHVEEPMGDPATVPLHYVSELARKYVTVVLSGEGSDEILAGYNIYEVYGAYKKNMQFRKIPGFVRNGLISTANDQFIKSDKLTRYLNAANNPLSHHHLFFINDHSRGSRFSVADKRLLFTEQAAREMTLHNNTELKRDLFLQAEEYSMLDQALYAQMKEWLPDDLLIKADRMTMAHSLELRVPFLDHTLAEYVNALPAHMKVRKKNDKYITKYILRKAYEDILPEEILTRPKKGFPVPLHKILKTHVLPQLKDFLYDSKTKEANIFNIPYIEGQIKQFENDSPSKSQFEKRLWSVYVYLKWQDYFA